MKVFRKYNLILGWTVFIVSAVVYLLTMESTASFWDCGEFITSSYKLEVGHPPGAPFFMILGRFFTLFAFSPEKISVSMNVMSALASAFTILFLFWTITHLAKKMIITSDSDYTNGKILTVLLAGVLGSLTYTFSDTFWFSAVEAEVYGTSSLFTAFVFWAILKWENIADDKHANRWIILIAYLMGLSLGVHLLNLLAIPAIVFVIYFRKYEVTRRGIIISILISVTLLGALMYVLIPGIILIGSWFELLFVNSFGLGFHSGLIFYTFLLFAAIAFAIYYTYNKKLVLWNTIVTVFAVIAIGYASYGVIIIRSNADTPLDESNPDSAFSLLKYLNRDQYGETPLFYGSYFNADVERDNQGYPLTKKGKPVYYRDEEEGKYTTVETSTYKYKKEFSGFIPRMWSTQEDHIQQYLYWANMDEGDLYEVQRDESGNPRRDESGQIMYNRSRPIAKPAFGQNLKFLFRYQIGYMYMRYFMWNFAGRQNEMQGHYGELDHGNWISGIKFIDDARLGPQDLLPDDYKDNPGRNKYFFLPFILGMIGLIFHYKKSNKDFWIVMLLFLFTGLAIVAYLNQYPLQPRERDYAYAGSFYAFAIWIGLSIPAIVHSISKEFKSVPLISLTGLIAILIVPVWMASENWDDHDRSGRYTARDFAYNYLNSCEENAIIFTNGDNDTFPLWYIQEVEDVRTDVRIINLSYFTADWYITQIGSKMNKSEAIQFGMNDKQYRNGVRDYVYVVNNTLNLINEKYETNADEFEKEYESLFNQFLSIISTSKLPEMAPKDYETLLRGHAYINVEQFANAVSRVKRRSSDLAVSEELLDELIEDIESFAKEVANSALEVDDAIKFILTDNPQFDNGDSYFIPSKKLVFKIDTAAVLKSGVLNEEQKQNIVDKIEFELRGRGIQKNSLMILDLINEINKGNWERPVYFAITASRENFPGLDAYLHREGLSYRVLPAFGNYKDLMSGGSVDVEKTYDNLMNKFRWGNIEDPGVYLDENNLRMLSYFRYTFATVANALIEQGNTDKAKEVMSRCMELMPNERVPYNISMMPIIQVYYNLEETETANQIMRTYAGMIKQILNYYNELARLKPSKYMLSMNDIQQTSYILRSLIGLAHNYQQEEIYEELISIYSMYDSSSRMPGSLME